MRSTSLLIVGTETEMAAVIVYGPQGCGKTRHAAEIAELFNKRQVLDNWKLGDHLPSDALCLTNDARVHGLEMIHMPGDWHPSRIIEFGEVAQALGIEEAA